MRTALSVLLLAAAPFGQNVLVVDGGGGAGVDFTDISSAVAAASSGEVVLVKSGSYAGFSVDGKSLTVTADETEVVRLTSGFEVRNTTAVQRVVLRGLGVDALTAEQCTITDNDGWIGLEDCTFDGVDPAGILAIDSTLKIDNSDNVVLTRCLVIGGVTPDNPLLGHGAGVRITDSDAFLYETSITGAHGMDSTGGSGADGGPAVFVAGGFAFLSGCALAGGDGGDGATSFLGCGDGGAGGPGLQTGTGSAVLQDTALTGGLGGAASGAPCVDGGTGGTFTGTVTSLPGTSHTMDVTTPVRMGALAHNILVGQPGEVAYLGISLLPSAAYTPLFLGAIHIGTPFNSISVGIVPFGGVITFDVLVPTIVGLESVLLFEQVAYLDFVGGKVTLSSPAFPLILSPIF